MKLKYAMNKLKQWIDISYIYYTLDILHVRYYTFALFKIYFTYSLSALVKVGLSP